MAYIGLNLERIRRLILMTVVPILACRCLHNVHHFAECSTVLHALRSTLHKEVRCVIERRLIGSTWEENLVLKWCDDRDVPLALLVSSLIFLNVRLEKTYITPLIL